ncbi:hypothetical protein, partial [Pseudomonas phage vB_Pae_BR141c]
GIGNELRAAGQHIADHSHGHRIDGNRSQRHRLWRPRNERCLATVARREIWRGFAQ